jgi:hypothetical protein
MDFDPRPFISVFHDYEVEQRWMSALGQERTLRQARPMSAIPPKADVRTDDQDVCFVPKADIPISDELIYVSAVGRSLTWFVVAQEAH